MSIGEAEYAGGGAPIKGVCSEACVLTLCREDLGELGVFDRGEKGVVFRKGEIGALLLYIANGVGSGVSSEGRWDARVA